MLADEMQAGRQVGHETTGLPFCFSAFLIFNKKLVVLCVIINFLYLRMSEPKIFLYKKWPPLPTL